MINSQLREGESLFNFKKSEKMLIAMPDPPPRTQFILSKFLSCKAKRLSTANNKTLRLKQLSK